MQAQTMITTMKRAGNKQQSSPCYQRDCKADYEGLPGDCWSSAGGYIRETLLWLRAAGGIHFKSALLSRAHPVQHPNLLWFYITKGSPDSLCSNHVPLEILNPVPFAGLRRLFSLGCFQEKTKQNKIDRDWLPPRCPNLQEKDRCKLSHCTAQS